MKVLLLRRFRLLILMVFLLACTLHIMVDLLPRLERRAAAGGEAAAGGGGAAGGVGGASPAGCSCAHSKTAAAAGGEGQQAQAEAGKGASEAGWPSKHTLRILQDFSSEPGSNLTSRSAEKGAAAAERFQGAHKALIPDAAPPGKQPQAGQGLQQQQQPRLQQAQAGAGGSKLAALFQQPLYRLAAPPLADHDVLFRVNSDIRFNPKAAENQEW